MKITITDDETEFFISDDACETGFVDVALSHKLSGDIVSMLLSVEDLQRVVAALYRPPQKDSTTP